MRRIVYAASGGFAAASLVVAGRSAAARVPDRPEAPAKVVVTGLPPLIELEPNLMGADRAKCVAAVVLVVSRQKQRVVLSSAGLGPTTFAPGSSAAGLCDARVGREPTMTLENVGTEGSRIQVVIPASAFPRSTDVMEGRIVAMTGRDSVAEFPLKLRRMPATTFETAASWFAGLLIPSVVAAVISYLAFIGQQWWTARSAARAEFAKYKFENDKDMRSLFHNVLVKVGADESVQTFSERAIKELRDKGALAKMPLKRRKRFLEELAGEDKSAIRNALLREFPEYRADVLRALMDGNDNGPA
jgi:hypothetical protein